MPQFCLIGFWVTSRNGLSRTGRRFEPTPLGSTATPRHVTLPLLLGAILERDTMGGKIINDCCGSKPHGTRKTYFTTAKVSARRKTWIVVHFRPTKKCKINSHHIITLCDYERIVRDIKKRLVVNCSTPLASTATTRHATLISLLGAIYFEEK